MAMRSRHFVNVTGTWCIDNIAALTPLIRGRSAEVTLPTPTSINPLFLQCAGCFAVRPPSRDIAGGWTLSCPNGMPREHPQKRAQPTRYPASEENKCECKLASGVAS